MTWTALSTSIALSTSWQYTAPTNAEYFRFKHTGQIIGQVYQLCSAMQNSEGSYDFYDSDALTLAVGSVNDVAYLPMPPCFTSRMIAIRQVPQLQTLEQQMRRLLVAAIFQDQVSVSAFYPANPSQWTVEIDASDAVAPTNAAFAAITGTLSSLGAEIPAIKTELDADTATIATIPAIKTELDQLNQQEQSSGGQQPSQTTRQLIYASPGDTNGLFYWIGSNKGTTQWANPYPQLVYAFVSSGGSNFTNFSCLTDVAVGAEQSVWFGSAIGDSFTVNLKDKKVRPVCYTLRSWTNGDRQMRNWKISGSADEKTWDDLDIRNNDTSLNGANAIAVFQINPVPAAHYQYLRFSVNGPDSNGAPEIALGGWEFYGEVIY